MIYIRAETIMLTPNVLHRELWSYLFIRKEVSLLWLEFHQSMVEAVLFQVSSTTITKDIISFYCKYLSFPCMCNWMTSWELCHWNFKVHWVMRVCSIFLEKLDNNFSSERQFVTLSYHSCSRERGLQVIIGNLIYHLSINGHNSLSNK